MKFVVFLTLFVCVFVNGFKLGDKLKASLNKVTKKPVEKDFFDSEFGKMKKYIYLNSHVLYHNLLFTYFIVLVVSTALSL